MKPIQYISNSCSNDYRFGFNGQEKDREIYNNENTTTATFWEYDGRIGRRWNVDPVPQVNMSDYSVMGCNPILNTDALGDEWGEKGDKQSRDDNKKQAEELKSDYKSKEVEYRTKAKNLKSEIEKIDDKKSNAFKELKTEYSEALKGAESMKQGQIEIDKMGTDKNNYFVFRAVDFPGCVSAKQIDKTTQTIYLNYRGGNTFAKIHETKHGYQTVIGLIKPNFEKKYILPIGETRMFDNFAKDLYSPEKQAYTRQFFYDKNSMPTSKNFPIIEYSRSISTKYLKSIGY